MLSRYDKAKEILEQALPLARQTKNRQAEAAILNNLGQTLESLGKYDQAMNTLNQALAIETSAAAPAICIQRRQNRVPGRPAASARPMPIPRSVRAKTW